jgi:hypothetical protein
MMPLTALKTDTWTIAPIRVPGWGRVCATSNASTSVLFQSVTTLELADAADLTELRPWPLAVPAWAALTATPIATISADRPKYVRILRNAVWLFSPGSRVKTIAQR